MAHTTPLSSSRTAAVAVQSVHPAKRSAPIESTFSYQGSSDSIQGLRKEELRTLIREETKKALEPSTVTTTWKYINGLSMAAMAAGMIWMGAEMAQRKRSNGTSAGATMPGMNM